MLSRESRNGLRNTLFRHLDGIGTAPAASALYEKGVLDFMLEKGCAGLAELSDKFSANEGYLNVALRILCSQGWLQQEVDNAANTVTYRTNELSEWAFGCIPCYRDVVELMKFSAKFHPRKFDKEPFQVLEQIFGKYKNNCGIVLSQNAPERQVQEQVLRHIEGMMVGPSVVRMGMSGMFHKYFMEASFRPEEFHADAGSFTRLLDIFTHLGWFIKGNGTYRFTEEGLFLAKRASAYGVTVSYIPTFRKLPELIFGDPAILKTAAPGEMELHVDREMNVWGSGGAHTGYFKQVDKIVERLFNQPIDEQPRGILDMGCGNGALLQHLFEVISNRTRRGEMLAEHPLFLIGADYNAEARRITKKNLIIADIWAKIIRGDIGDPEQLDVDVRRDYGLKLEDLLSVRTFLDHNRPWREPEHPDPKRVSASTGAFACVGKRISNNAAEDSLLEHFKRWEPFVRRFGLLVMELHTIAPGMAAKNLGKIAATAYDATHGFSDQYIIEAEVFRKIAIEAGLHPDPEAEKQFPGADLPSITINLLKG